MKIILSITDLINQVIDPNTRLGIAINLRKEDFKGTLNVLIENISEIKGPSIEIENCLLLPSIEQITYEEAIYDDDNFLHILKTSHYSASGTINIIVPYYILNLLPKRKKNRFKHMRIKQQKRETNVQKS